MQKSFYSEIFNQIFWKSLRFKVLNLLFSRCGGCDTLFGDIVHLDHHKDEYEHWSEGDDAHLPCCQRNRRIEFEFSDSDSDSEAQSEDLERLI